MASIIVDVQYDTELGILFENSSLSFDVDSNITLDISNSKPYSTYYL